MNATPSIFQALPNNDLVQPSTSPSAASQANRSNRQDFAGAMNDAGDAKPARKNSPRNSHADSSGGQLPPSGNQTPPVAPLPATRSDAPPPIQGSGGSKAAAPPAVAAGATSNTGAGAAGAAPDAPGNAPPVSSVGAEDPNVPVIAAPATLSADGSVADPDAPDQTAGEGLTMPHATAMATTLSGTASPAAVAAPISAGTKTAAGERAAAPPSGGRVAKPDATAGKAAIDAATSAPTSAADSAASDSTLAGAAPDPTAQAIMAAAGAETTGAQAIDSSSPYDVSAPDPGVAPQGVQGPNASPAAAVAATAMQAAASTAAAVTAATAASIAQAISATAGAGAADKHSRDNAPDSTAAGVANDGTAGAAQLLSASSSTSSTDTPTPAFKIPAGVDSTEFGQGVADRVSLMMDSNLTSAKLQVNPPALGPIEVRIALQSGHAQVWFTSHSAVTRDALESSAPKLREMLGAQGFGQVSVDISQRSFQDRPPPSKGYEAMPATGRQATAVVESPSAHSRIANGLLDAYA
jgi:flagellar hook-length control protein FliK